MRLMLKFTIPVEKGNQAMADGSMSQAIQDLINTVQPESAYFYVEDGKRAGMVVFEASEQAQMAADGKWDELKKWQDELDGGKA